MNFKIKYAIVAFLLAIGLFIFAHKQDFILKILNKNDLALRGCESSCSILEQELRRCEHSLDYCVNK
jgi:hypothetical protein